jgi:hypothetical protein
MPQHSSATQECRIMTSLLRCEADARHMCRHLGSGQGAAIFADCANRLVNERFAHLEKHSCEARCLDPMEPVAPLAKSASQNQRPVPAHVVVPRDETTQQGRKGIIASIRNRLSPIAISYPQLFLKKMFQGIGIKQ